MKITRRQFEAMCGMLRGDLIPGVLPEGVVRRMLNNASIEVEKTPEERLKDFFAAYHEWVRDIATDLHELQHLVIQHFPELAQHD